MAGRSKEQEPKEAQVADDFPYKAWMSHPAWEVVDQELGELEDNGDLELQTARRYVIGSVVKSLAEKGLLPPLPPPLHPLAKGVIYRWVAIRDEKTFGWAVTPGVRTVVHHGTGVKSKGVKS